MQATPQQQQAFKQAQAKKQTYDVLDKNMQSFQKDQTQGTGKRVVPDLGNVYAKSQMPYGATAQADKSFVAFQKATNGGLPEFNPNKPISMVTKDNVPKLTADKTNGVSKPDATKVTGSTYVSPSLGTNTKGQNQGTTAQGQGQNQGNGTVVKDLTKPVSFYTPPAQKNDVQDPLDVYKNHNDWVDSVGGDVDYNKLTPAMRKNVDSVRGLITNDSRLTLMEIDRTNKKIADMKAKGLDTTAQEKYLKSMNDNLGRLKMNPNLDTGAKDSIASKYKTPAEIAAEASKGDGTPQGGATDKPQGGVNDEDTTKKGDGTDDVVLDGLNDKPQGGGTSGSNSNTQSDTQAFLDAYNKNSQDMMDNIDAQAETERRDLDNQNFLKNLSTVRNFARRGSLDSGMYQNALAQQAFANAASLDKINSRADSNKLKLSNNLLNNQFRSYSNNQRLQTQQDIANNKISANERIANAKLDQQQANKIADMQKGVFTELSKNYDTSPLAPIMSAYFSGNLSGEELQNQLNNFYKTKQVAPQDQAKIAKDIALAQQAIENSQYIDAKTAGVFNDQDGYIHDGAGQLILDEKGNPVKTLASAWKEADLGIKSRLADARQQSVINQGKKMASDEGYRAANISIRLQNLIRQNAVDVNKASNAPLNSQLKFINSRIYAIGQSVQNGTPTPEQQQELANLAGAGVSIINDMKKNAKATTDVLNTQTSNVKGQ